MAQARGVIGEELRHLFEFGELGVDVGSEAVPGRAGEKTRVAQSREVLVSTSCRCGVRSFADEFETRRTVLGERNTRSVRL